jgi:hypothetical protein
MEAVVAKFSVWASFRRLCIAAALGHGVMRLKDAMPTLIAPSSGSGFQANEMLRQASWCQRFISVSSVAFFCSNIFHLHQSAHVKGH